MSSHHRPAEAPEAGRGGPGAIPAGPASPDLAARAAAARELGMDIVLVGLMGAGKTSVGRALAARLGWRFVDTDALVEAGTGRTVAQIFVAEGEGGFRRREAAAIAGLAGPRGVAEADPHPPLAGTRPGGRVVAAGGGAVLLPGNRERLRALGPVVWLQARPETLASRVGAGEERPLLGADPAATLARLAAERAPPYQAAADCAVATDGKTVAEAARAVGHLALPRPVTVALAGGAYTVWIGPALLRRAGVIARRAGAAGAAGAGPGVAALLVSDPNPARAWAGPVTDALRDAGLAPHRAGVPPGEASKTLEVVAGLYDAALAAGLDRSGWVFALGGGATGDAAGFFAATWLRGVAFVPLPTTLLSQADAAIGGKVAVNLPAGKNLVGAFWQPRAVVCDPGPLATLDDRSYRAGLAEVLKYGVTGSPSLVDRLEARSGAVLAREPGEVLELVEAGCRMKAAVVAHDEREAGLRQVLNFGHTAGHAVEAATGYSGVLHGEAVAAGMVLACRLGTALLGAPAALEERVTALLSRFDLPTRLDRLGVAPPAVADLLAATARDKKAAGGALRMVLPEVLGRVRYGVPVTAEDFAAACIALGARP